MKLINGRDLLDDLASIKDIHERLSLLETIARTLVFAHSRNVVHRDVKPANVIVDRTAGVVVPVLTDFDLAWIPDRSTITSAAYASLKYGAPEQFENRLSVHRSKPTVDVFSFGALMYYVLTDQEPPPMGGFQEANWDVVQSRLQGRLFQAVIADLVDLLKSSTQRDPARRPQTMSAVVGRLAAVRAQGFDDDRVLDIDRFVGEVVGEYGGRQIPGGAESVSGGTQWRISANGQRGDRCDLNMTITLLRKPAVAGKTMDEFRKLVLERIDATLRKHAKVVDVPRWIEGLERATGYSTTEWSIKVTGLHASRRSAVRLAHMMSEVGASVE